MTRSHVAECSIGLERISKVGTHRIFQPCLAYYFAGIDSSLADDFGRTVTHGMSAIITFSTLTIVGGLRSAIAVCILLAGYYRSECFNNWLCKNGRFLMIINITAARVNIFSISVPPTFTHQVTQGV